MLIFDNISCIDIKLASENNFNNLIARLKDNNPSTGISALDIRGELDSNQFIELLGALEQNTTVESLILRGKQYLCDLSNESIYTHLSVLLFKNKTLKSLTLFHTGLKDEGAEMITGALQNNSTLAKLKISGDRLTKAGKLFLVKMATEKKAVGDFTLDHEGFDNNMYMFNHEFFQTPEPSSISAIEENNNYKIKKKNEFVELLRKAAFSKDSINKVEVFLDSAINWDEEFKSRYLELKKTKKINYAATKEGRKEQENYKMQEVALIKEYIDQQNKGYQEFPNIWKAFLLNYSKEVKQSYVLEKKQVPASSAAEHNEDAKNNGAEVKMEEIFPTVEPVLIEETSPSGEEADKPFSFANNDEEIKAVEISLPEGSALIEEEFPEVEEKGKEKDTSSMPIDVDKGKEAKSIDSIKTYMPPKKLEIQDSTATEYLAEWVNQVSSNEYEFAVISVGGHNQISQQIPEFTNSLGNVAILNIDLAFSEYELGTKPSHENLSLNYIKGQIEGHKAAWMGSEEKLKARNENSDYITSTITQDNLKDKIKELIKADKKVVLLSHTSVTAPILIFEKVLVDKAIMDNYEDKFVFIHSYFNDSPAIVCSKSLVEKMMSNHEDFGATEAVIFEVVTGEDGFYKKFHEKSFDNVVGGGGFASRNLDLLDSSDILSMMGDSSYENSE